MPSKTFKTTIHRDGSMCFIPVPFDPKPVFGKVRAPVRVTLNGYSFRSTIAAMGGPPCIPLRKSNREAAGLEGGETMEVRLDLDTDARMLITPPADLVRALKAAPPAMGSLARAELQPPARARRSHRAGEEAGDTRAAHRRCRSSPAPSAGEKARALMPHRAHEALERLREGNRRFVEEVRRSHAAGGRDRRMELAAGQDPSAIILGCSDSRVPAELVFDQGLGDLFVIRVAGNIVAPSQVGSVEFAAERVPARGSSSSSAIRSAVPSSPRSKN